MTYIRWIRVRVSVRRRLGSGGSQWTSVAHDSSKHQKHREAATPIFRPQLLVTMVPKEGVSK